MDAQALPAVVQAFLADTQALLGGRPSAGGRIGATSSGVSHAPEISVVVEPRLCSLASSCSVVVEVRRGEHGRPVVVDERWRPTTGGVEVPRCELGGVGGRCERR